MANLWKNMWSSARVCGGRKVENLVENEVPGNSGWVFIIRNAGFMEKSVWYVNKNMPCCGNNKLGRLGTISTKSEVST